MKVSSPTSPPSDGDVLSTTYNTTATMVDSKHDEKDGSGVRSLTQTPSLSPSGVPALGSDIDSFYRNLPPSLQSLTRDQTAKMERKLVRSLDFRILPIAMVMFVFNIIDRNGLTNAKLGGLEKDIGLSSIQYNSVLMILYVGYLLAQVPSNAILTKTRPSIYLPAMMILWGAVSAITAATRSYAGIFLCRFFIGFLEAPFMPGIMFVLSCFYTRAELPARIAFYYCGNSLSNAFGGLFAAGILRGLDGVHGIEGWRWIFIIEGSITIGLACFAFFLLPDWPGNTRWLSQEQRDLAEYRMLRDNNGAIDTSDRNNFWDGIQSACKDPLTWLLVLFQHALLVSQSYTYFFPSIVKTLGYGNTESLLLTAPPYFFAFFLSVLISWHAGKVNERCLHIVAPMILSIIGNILVLTVTGTGGRYFGMFLQCLGPYCVFALVIAWISAAMPRPKDKRAIVLALANAIGNGSHLYTSYIFPDKDAPRYLPGGIVIIVFSLLLIGICFTLRFIFNRRNRTFQEAERLDPVDGNPFAFGFRYSV